MDRDGQNGPVVQLRKHNFKCIYCSEICLGGGGGIWCVLCACLFHISFAMPLFSVETGLIQWEHVHMHSSTHQKQLSICRLTYDRWVKWRQPLILIGITDPFNWLASLMCEQTTGWKSSGLLTQDNWFLDFMVPCLWTSKNIPRHTQSNRPTQAAPLGAFWTSTAIKSNTSCSLQPRDMLSIHGRTLEQQRSLMSTACTLWCEHVCAPVFLNSYHIAPGGTLCPQQPNKERQN